jgi:hypothetical protein
MISSAATSGRLQSWARRRERDLSACHQVSLLSIYYYLFYKKKYQLIITMIQIKLYIAKNFIYFLFYKMKLKINNIEWGYLY